MNTLLRKYSTETPEGLETRQLDFDLRPKRDLLSRRISSDIRRRVARVFVLLLLDGMSVTGALAASAAVAGSLMGASVEGWIGDLLWIGFLMILGQLAANTYGQVRQVRILERVGLGWFLSLVALGTAALAQVGEMNWTALLLFAGVVGPGLVVSRLAIARMVTALYRHGIAVRNAVIIAPRSEARQLVRRYRAGHLDEIRIVGHLCEESAADPTAMGTIGDLPRILEDFDIRNVIVSSHLGSADFRSLVAECFMQGAAVSVVPATITEIPARVGSRDVLGWPILELRVPRLHLLQLFLKRMLDITGALVGLVFLAPFLFVIAAVVRLEGAPVLFRQERLGLGGSPFTIFKFRSMRPDAESLLKSNEILYRKYLANDFKLPAGEDPRISRLGAFLRRTSLDELPQLFNVLKGDMSLVGPRPIVPDEIAQYGDHARTFLAVKPGITGWWQVNGRSEVGYPERVDIDLDYVKRWSIFLDVKILLLTIPRLFQGAH